MVKLVFPYRGEGKECHTVETGFREVAVLLHPKGRMAPHHSTIVRGTRMVPATFFDATPNTG